MTNQCRIPNDESSARSGGPAFGGSPFVIPSFVIRHSPLPSFLDRPELRLLLFGGKGGVGKTTCAAAAALHLARRFPDRRFLTASTDPAHSLKDSFAASPLPANLGLLEIDSGTRAAEFKDAHAAQLREIARRGTFLDDEDVSRLLELSLPGLDEIMAFNEISALVEGEAYSCIVLDTAPTGHTLRFLELPKVLRGWLQALDAMLAKHRYMARLYRGFCRKDETDVFLEELAGSIERLASLLSDPVRCCFVPVLLAEALSRMETRRLVDKLESMGIVVRDILVNRLYPAPSDCPVCRDVCLRQRDELRAIAAELAGHVLWEIPLQGAEVRGTDRLAAFWDEGRAI